MKTSLYIFVTLFVLQIVSSRGQSSTCDDYVFKSPRTNFTSCVDLPVLNSSIHWTYHPINATIDMAYRHTGAGPTSSKWVVWAINPIGKTMVGSQCLVAYHDPKDGSMVAYTSSISSYATQLIKGDLSFKVYNLSAVGVNDEIIIYATMVVPKNVTTVNQVWQDGLLSSDGKPMMHSLSGPNVLSMASLNLLSGVAVTVPASATVSPLKYIHGALNAVSWGILMPIGAMTVRYMRVFPAADPLWFYLHVGCQLSGYSIGVAGFITGLKLGSKSVGVSHYLHRILGIVIFTLATIQICALFIRPKKDHKYRIFWNIYHHSVGYTIIILSIINVMKGFKILGTVDTWKQAYVGIILALACIAVFLEVFTWYYKLCRRRKEGDEKTVQHPPV